MKTSSPKTWRRELLESHLGLSRGTTSAQKNLRRPGHHHRLAEDSFKVHCAPVVLRLTWWEGTLCSSGGKPWTLVWQCIGEAAILSRLVELYIPLRMCKSIRAISERSLLHCSLTSAPGHHASRRWIVEKLLQQCMMPCRIR